MSIMLAGLLLGLASAAHCAGMCGPLVLVYRRYAAGPGSLVVYHVGRVGTYALFGALAGAAGQAMSFDGLGGIVSIVAGLGLIGIAWRRLAGPAGTRAGRLSRWMAPLFAESRVLLATHPVTGSLAAGVLNAFVPCGLLYAAVTTSAAAPTPAWAAASMVAFGAGTTLALAAVWWSAGLLGRARLGRLRYAVPAALALTGVLLIGRGLVHHRHDSVPASQTAVPVRHHH